MHNRFSQRNNDEKKKKKTPMHKTNIKIYHFFQPPQHSPKIQNLNLPITISVIHVECDFCKC